jgi:hypothetical protein
LDYADPHEVCGIGLSLSGLPVQEKIAQIWRSALPGSAPRVQGRQPPRHILSRRLAISRIFPRNIAKLAPALIRDPQAITAMLGVV